MQESKPKILIVSSADPTNGSGILASDYYEALKGQGCEVDVLTLYRCVARPEYLYVRDLTRISERIKNKIRREYNKLYNNLWAHKHHCLKEAKKGHYFSYFEEENPPVSESEILSKIKKNYDIVYVLFWFGMLSFATIRAIYNKLHCCIIFGGVDYSHMSGGCHFTGDCERYKTGCGCCPAFESDDPHDFTWRNVIYRKQVYSEVKPIVRGNSYMIEFYKQSELLRDYNYAKTQPIIDTTLFKPIDKDILHEDFGISKEKTFKVLFGCRNISDVRKGVNYLIEALNIFADKLTEEERKHVLFMAIGNDFESVRAQLHDIDTFNFGFVNKEELAKIYAFADVFLCPSINDAGPMMVNQSLCCGTPVVGFEMGACLDAVKGQGTGWCAKLCDSLEFATYIEKIYRQTSEERVSMSNRCVEFARKTYSFEASANRIIDLYKSSKL